MSSESSSDFQSNAIAIPKDLVSFPPCTMCSVQPPSVAHCDTCETYLCEQCDSAHKLMVCFKTHKVQPLNNSQKKCLSHCEEELAYCCFTCYEFTCTKCIDEKHNMHDVCPIFQSDIKIRIALEKMYFDGKSQLDNLMKFKTDLDEQLAKAERQKWISINQINEMHTNFQEILKQYRDDIIESLHEQYGLGESLIVDQKIQLDQTIEELQSKLTGLDTALDGKRINGFASQNGFLSLNNDFSTPESSSYMESDKYEENLAEDFPQLKFNLDQLLADDSDSTPMSTTSGSREATSDPISPSSSTKHVNSVQIYKTFGQKGNASGQFNSPHGFCLGFDEDIVVADSSNHRVQIFDKTGVFKTQFGLPGRHDGCLWYPRRIALLPTKREYVVCDRGYERSRMQIFTESGNFVRKIYIQYIDIVSGIAVTDDENIIVVDSVTPTLFILGQNEYLRSIDCSEFMQEPSDLAVLGKEIYICDFKGHAVCVVNHEGNLLRKFGTSNTTTFPNGIDISLNGEVLIGDSHGNFFHICVYTKDGEFVSQFRCPYVKVSRCCGLKVTSEGHLVTVDKNYHHIIMLDTLYVTSNTK